MSGRILILAALLIALFAAGPASAQVANGYTGSGSSGGGVSSVSAVAPILSSGGTTPSISLSLGTAGQFLQTNAAASAAVWVSCSGDVACATATPGQRNITGIGTLAGGTVTLGNGSTGVNFTAATATSGAGLNTTFTASAPTTAGGAGSFIFNFPAPASGTAQGAIVIEGAGTVSGSLQPLVGAATWIALYGNVTPSGTNYAFTTNPAGSVTSLNVASGGTLTFQTAGGNRASLQASTFSGTPNTGGTFDMWPVQSGTVNSQTLSIRVGEGTVELTHGAAATTALTVAQATSATSAHYHVRAIRRATTLFTGGATSDTWATEQEFVVRNVGGTLTAVASVTVATSTYADTSMASNALSMAFSGTSVLFQLTPPNVAAGVEDCTVLDSQLLN